MREGLWLACFIAKDRQSSLKAMEEGTEMGPELRVCPSPCPAPPGPRGRPHVVHQGRLWDTSGLPSVWTSKAPCVGFLKN